jgi:pimeloyl-ACP methyl ester carboxylesterase
MNYAVLIVACVILLAGCAHRRSFEAVSYENFRTSGGNSFVKLQDGWTNYELLGDSSAEHTVVLIHGGTIPLCIWNAQVDALVKAGFRVLRYDQYGRGYSDRPDTEYSRELFLQQLKGLLDSLRISDPVSLIGPSFGGAVSVSFGARYPERVRSIILVSPALNLINSDSPLAGNIKLLRTPVLGISLYRIFVRSKLISRGRSLVPGGKGSLCDSTFQKQFTCKGTEHSLFSMFKSDAYGDYRKETRLAAASVKNIILLRGKEDKDITEKMVKEMREDLPGVQYVEIEKSGHNPGSDAANIFNELIVGYLSSH